MTVPHPDAVLVRIHMLAGCDEVGVGMNSWLPKLVVLASVMTVAEFGSPSAVALA